MSKKQRFYVVWSGRETGIFDTWDACKAQVHGYAGARYKAFDSYSEARRAVQDPYGEHLSARKAARPKEPPTLQAVGPKRPIAESYAVDAACTGNPGLLEYRCVHVATGKEVFREGPFKNGTNNIGEFLAIVDGLRMLTRNKSTVPVYSDSKVAIGWVKSGTCRTRHTRTKENGLLFERIEAAQAWLRGNRYENQILKWDTAAWGEIPADFGRK